MLLRSQAANEPLDTDIGIAPELPPRRSLESEEVLAAGMDDLVRKPYRREEILDWLARQLEWRGELAHALISLDAGRIAAAIHSVSGHDPVLGGTLVRSAGRFAYTPILETLEACRSNSAEGRI